MHFFQHHIGDYAKDTSHLTWDEDMAYTRLLRAYYAKEAPIPEAETYRLARASTRGQRGAVDAVLKEFFNLGPDGWHNKRADEEIVVSREKSERARDSANKLWQSKRSNANAMPTLSEGNAPNNQEPITNNQEPLENLTLATAREAKPAVPPCPHLEIIDLYHKHFPMGQRVKAKLWDGKRSQHLQARWREDTEYQSLDWWDKHLAYCATSRFLTGQVPSRHPGEAPFRVSLDFLVQRGNFVKCLEEHFHRELKDGPRKVAL